MTTYRVRLYDHDLHRFSDALAARHAGRRVRRVRLFALRPVIRLLRRHWDDVSILVESND